MKQYIDGIKEVDEFKFRDKLVKHIPITYYKPLNVYDFTDTNTGNYDGIGLSNLDNLKWVDGQPYELVTLNKGVKSL